MIVFLIYIITFVLLSSSYEIYIKMFLPLENLDFTPEDDDDYLLGTEEP